MSHRHYLIPHVRGPFGVGKTALVRHWQTTLEPKGSPVVYLEAGSRTDLFTLVARRLPRAVVAALGRQPGKLSSRLASRLRHVSISLNPISGVGLAVNSETRPTVVGDEYDRLEAIGELVAEVAADVGQPTVLVIDEIGLTTDEDGDRLMELQRLVRGAGLPLGFVFVGNYVRRALGRASYASRMTSDVDLAPLRPDDVAMLLETGVAAVGGSWSSDGLRLAIEKTEGNPWLAGLVTNTAWDISAAKSITRTDKSITRSDVEGALDVVREDLARGVHRRHWEAHDDLARHILLRAASEDSETIEALLTEADRTYQTPEGLAVERLVEAETIRVNWTAYTVEILIPWFADFLRRLPGSIDPPKPRSEDSTERPITWW